MNWNWFFIIILVAFVAMHLFGYGCCGGHAQHGYGGDQQSDETEGREHEDERE
jgi:hypothetical protein